MERNMMVNFKGALTAGTSLANGHYLMTYKNKQIRVVSNYIEFIAYDNKDAINRINIDEFDSFTVNPIKSII